MRLRGSMALSVFLFIIFANELIMVQSRFKFSKGLKKVFKKGEKAMGYADQVSETVGELSGKTGASLVMGVAETISSFAPSPVGPFVSLGLSLFGSAHQKSEEVEAIEQAAQESKERDEEMQDMLRENQEMMKEMEEDSEAAHEETQNMLSEQGELVNEMEENSQERDELTQELIGQQMMMLEGIEEASRERDLETQRMIDNQISFLGEMSKSFKERDAEKINLIKEKYDEIALLVEQKSKEVIDGIANKKDRNDMEAVFEDDILKLNTFYNDTMNGLDEESLNTKTSLEDSIKHSSAFRVNLDNFVKNHIKASDDVFPSSPQLMYFQGFLNDERKNIRENTDCGNKSTQTKVLDSYVRIIKTLTNAHSLVATALAIQYETQKKANAKVDGTKRSLMLATKDFMNQLKTLMDVTRYTLNHASAEIRRCGLTIQNEEYGGLDFLKIALIGYRNSLMLRRDHVDIYPSVMWEYVAEKNSSNPWNYFDYSKFNCKDSHLKNIEYFFDPDIPVPGYHHIYDNEKSETYGNKDDVENLESYSITGDMKQCYVYSKTKKAGFSTQSVEAQPGHVVTGIRWRITDNIVYMDIREAKFINGLQVDRSTEEWYETPTSDEFIEPFTEHHRGILLADVQLGTGFFVTGVKMIFINGKLTLSVRGSGTNEPGTKLFGLQSYVRPKSTKSSEWKINEADDPKQSEGNDTFQKIVRVQTGKNYYVNLQPTDFKKDLGRKTVPYFDFQNVITNPSVPIGGLGIYYRIAEGYGGVVGLKIFSPDYSNMIDEESLEMYEQSFHWNSTLNGKLGSKETRKLKKNGKRAVE